ncbi:HdeD family acid-resistance protein [Hyphomicrobium sp.]|uniref:HdeD family acid-resistance protein n=1 Tax=Hyphomicrobium sp. TaxID=82 RepID=UPI002D76DB80|nr:HdeD family acid-resistance protein [Hyphomicrobium sp.]HET6387950.1 HdeD family acid-resistance protein [Hyphomicrobium sp.]
MTVRPIMETRPQEDPSWWGAILLGAVFIIAGLIVLGDVVAATVISAFLIGIVLIIAGISEVFQSFSAPHWRSFFWRLLIGLLYAVAGLMLVTNPAGASIALTLVFALALIASGIVRIVQAMEYWQWFGWLLLASGIVGIAAGLVILSKWPISGLWVLGLVVGIDLLVHGFWWITLGLGLRRDSRAIAA